VADRIPWSQSCDHLHDQNAMTMHESYRIIAEDVRDDHKVQLVEDQKGVYHLRKVSADEDTIFNSAPVYSDSLVLAEARESFPDFLPFGALPVDAT